MREFFCLRNSNPAEPPNGEQQYGQHAMNSSGVFVVGLATLQVRFTVGDIQAAACVSDAGFDELSIHRYMPRYDRAVESA